MLLKFLLVVDLFAEIFLVLPPLHNPCLRRAAFVPKVDVDLPPLSFLSFSPRTLLTQNHHIASKNAHVNTKLLTKGSGTELSILNLPGAFIHTYPPRKAKNVHRMIP